MVCEKCGGLMRVDTLDETATCTECSGIVYLDPTPEPLRKSLYTYGKGAEMDTTDPGTIPVLKSLFQRLGHPDFVYVDAAAPRAESGAQANVFQIAAPYFRAWVYKRIWGASVTMVSRYLRTDPAFLDFCGFKIPPTEKFLRRVFTEILQQHPGSARAYLEQLATDRHHLVSSTTDTMLSEVSPEYPEYPEPATPSALEDEPTGLDASVDGIGDIEDPAPEPGLEPEPIESAPVESETLDGVVGLSAAYPSIYKAITEDIRGVMPILQEYIDKQRYLLENAEYLLSAYQQQLEALEVAEAGLEHARAATNAITQIRAQMPLGWMFEGGGSDGVGVNLATPEISPVPAAIEVESEIFKVTAYHCRCGHEWVPKAVRQTVSPRVCPKCKSANWDQPYQLRRKVRQS